MLPLWTVEPGRTYHKVGSSTSTTTVVRKGCTLEDFLVGNALPIVSNDSSEQDMGAR